MLVAVIAVVSDDSQTKTSNCSGGPLNCLYGLADTAAAGGQVSADERVFAESLRGAYAASATTESLRGFRYDYRKASGSRYDRRNATGSRYDCRKATGFCFECSEGRHFGLGSRLQRRRHQPIKMGKRGEELRMYRKFCKFRR